MNATSMETTRRRTGAAGPGAGGQFGGSRAYYGGYGGGLGGTFGNAARFAVPETNAQQAPAPDTGIPGGGQGPPPSEFGRPAPVKRLVNKARSVSCAADAEQRRVPARTLRCTAAVLVV